MANRTRNIQLKICLNEEEKQIFEKKMKLTKCKTMSHFIRKSVLEGDIFVVDLQPFVDLQGLLYNATNNINQIAKRVNTTALIYKDEGKNRLPLKRNLANTLSFTLKNT